MYIVPIRWKSLTWVLVLLPLYPSTFVVFSTTLATNSLGTAWSMVCLLSLFCQWMRARVPSRPFSPTIRIRPQYPRSLLSSDSSTASCPLYNFAVHFTGWLAGYNRTTSISCIKLAFHTFFLFKTFPNLYKSFALFV